MDKFARVPIVRSIVIQLFVSIVVAKTGANEVPKAEKLTKAVDPRIPPQIAYFIPDQALNSTFLKDINGYNSFNGFGGDHPAVINMWFSDQKSDRSSKIKDLEVSQQRPFHFVSAPKQEKRLFNPEEDPSTAFQTFNYQINFGKTPKKIADKEPDFKRFRSSQNVTGSGGPVKKAKKPKKYIKRPVSFNYANTSPNIRTRIKKLKMNHENKFEVTTSKQRASDFNGVYSDDHDTDVPNKEPTKVYNTETKLRKILHRKKPQYSTIKLSHPMLNDENESSYNYDNGNVDEVYNYPKHRHNEHCEHPNTEMADHFNTENDPNENIDTDIDFIENGTPQKGFAIYLTKVIHPKPKSKNKIRRTNKKKPAQNEFVPSRIMSSVRRISEVVHKPRKIQQPTLREKLTEEGGHVVYTEDGYDDEYYDHGKEDKNLEYISRARSRRSTNVKDLKGQELIDHIDILIRNVSDYLNSSEIIPDTHKKYPLYNSSNENIKNSPIKYSEYAKPVVNENISSELYESKTKDCEEVEDNIDLSEAHNDTNGTKKRLGKLGVRLECLKKKLFGDKPLDNPLFNENNISQPQSDNIFSNIAQEAENIQTISSVYSDVMDNIKYNSFNEYQRVFSDFGLSDNYALGTINTQSAVIKPLNELNTSEKYPDHRPKSVTRARPKVTEDSPLIFSNPFQDPSQLPILDISAYIPTPRYPPTASDYALQTDFKPIFSPYAGNYKYQALTTTSTTSAPTTPTTPTTPLYGPIRTLAPPYRKVQSGYQVANNPQNAQNSNVYRTGAQSVVRIVKRRRPISGVRGPPKNPLISPRY